MEKTGLGERLKAKLLARKQRSAERARIRREQKIESNAQRAAAARGGPNYGGDGGGGGG